VLLRHWLETAVRNTRGYQSPLHMPPPPGCLHTRIKGFYDLHNKVLSPPTRVLPPQSVGPQEYIYPITLNPVASTVPRQCIPLYPNGSCEKQSGSITRSNCIQHHPSTSSAPTTTAWAPNCAFDLPLYIQQRCCDPLCTVRLSVIVHQCNAGLCASRTPQVLGWMRGKPTHGGAPVKVRAPLPSDMLHGCGSLQA
jgi:hypothetical protein